MTSIGETLRRERLRRNLELDQVSRELKIPAKLLTAIEAEDFAQLPHGVFAKSFVRQYARLLELDEEDAANQVQRALAPPEPVLTQPGPAEHRPKAASISEFYVPKVESWEHVGDSGRFSWSSPLPALGLFVVAMLGCSLIYGWWQRQKHPVTAAIASAPQAVRHAAAAPPPPAATPASTEVAATLPPAQSKPEPPATSAATQRVQTPAPVSTGSGAVKVAVTAEEVVWILARSDGKYLFSGTLAPNETRTVEAENTVLLRLGNAGGVTITLNGRPIGEVGPKGQVRTVQLTSGGFQIVAPKPSAPAVAPF